jgi:drug/metabolite transporter (DMT)-like permease
MTRLQADCILLFAAALWGIAFFFQKDAMQHVGPLTFIAARAILAAIVLTPLAIFEHRNKKPASTASTGLRTVALASGAAFLLAAFLQQEGLRTASVTNTGFLTSLYVVLTPLVAWIVSATAPPRIVWPAIALSFLGTWLLGGGAAGGLGLGDLLVMAGSLFWAIHCVITARASLFERPLTYTALQFAAVAVAATVGAVLFENPTIEAIGAARVPILFVGLVSTALTYTIFSIAIRHTTPPEAAVLLSAESLFAAGAGALFLGDRLSVVSWSGAGLMIAAVILVQLGPWLRRSALRGAASG